MRELIQKRCFNKTKQKESKDKKEKRDKEKQDKIKKEQEESDKRKEENKKKIEENKKKKDNEKKQLNNLSKEEQEKIKQQKKEEKAEQTKLKHIEFPYLEELTDTQYKDLQTSNWVVSDPGKRCLFYMKNKGKKFRYTNGMHMRRTKRKEYEKKMKKYKEMNQIKEEEDKLIGYNSKTCNYEKFKEYIKKKNEVNVILIKKYEEKFFRQYKWYSYINRKRTEDRLVTDIQDNFGKDVTLIIGDWSDKMRKTPSQIKYISSRETEDRIKKEVGREVYCIQHR